ncbi:MAG TPA: MupA/Atu3671 family FMN-dependent luciferase-like monooxygenase [Opitutaceae bacterium]
MSSREHLAEPGWGRQPTPTLAEILQWRASRQAGRRAFTFLPDAGGAESSHTYGTLDRRARAIAAQLRRRLAAGERAALLFPPGLEFVEAFFGCLYAGVVAVPAYPPRNRGHLPRLRSLLADSGARLALTTARTAETIRSQFAGGAEWAGLELLATDAVDSAAADGWTGADPDPDALAFLQYTSGSTGAPKGVMVTHRNLCYGAHYIRTEAAADGDAVSVCWLPSFHDMGLVDGVLMPVYAGCHGVLLSPVGFVQRPASWLEAVTRFRGTHGGAPNFGYELCVRKIPPEARAQFDLSSWTSAYNGAEPLRASTLRAFTEAFAPCGFRPQTLYPTYGLAEATLMVTGGTLVDEPIYRLAQRSALAAGRFAAPDAATPPEDVAELVSSGHTILETRVAVVADGRRCASGVVGEVWIGGPTVAAGYWQRPAETAETFQARIEGEAEAWLRTGDLAFLDEAGELFICGRAKDLIIIRARNHYPQDIEETAGRAHPALRGGGAAAFAVDDEDGEQLVVALEVERAELRKLDAAAVGAAVARRIAEEHGVTPRTVILLKPGGVPKTSSGKVQRSETRKRYQAGTLESAGEWQAGTDGFRAAPPVFTVSAPPPPGEVARWLTEALARRIGLRPDEIDARTSFAAYGLDSAAHVELAGELQTRLGRPVPPMVLFDYPDIARLSAYLTGKSDAGPPGGRVSAGKEPGDDAVAIVGLGLRLPGGADTPEAFWRLLQGGVDAITEVPGDRWDHSAVYDPEPATPGATNSRHGGFIEGIDQFDADFFGISPREAAALDPQQRLLLETAWHALEDAGLDPPALAGSRAGVYVGISTQDYARRTLPSVDLERIEAHSGTGSALSAAAGRLSYFFDFRGPAVATDTACSSSLVAVHQACRALLDGECDFALAAGVNAILGPELAINFAQARMLAPDGRCKAFDASADGYVRSEGCGVVVLKRLSAALAEGDPVLAVIRGSAVGQDGRSNGLTAPNGPAQEQVIRAALGRAGLPSSAISYVEAHGTGTALGDPIEVRALNAVFGERPEGSPLWIGSVKTNLGHLEAAAGIASLAKVVLSLRQGELPANLHFRSPSPHISWDQLALKVVGRRMAWPASADGSPRRAGISAFGFTGTNAHLIVEEAPAALAVATPKAELPGSAPPATGPFTIPLSARAPEPAQQLAAAFADWFETHPAAPLADVIATAARSRTSHSHRILASGGTREELIASLRTARAVASPSRTPSVAFLFTGQGSATAKSGGELFAAEPAFRASLERSAAVLDPLLPVPLLSVIRDGAPGGWERTEFAQPALFALEWALVELLAEWGVHPAAVLGHSVGEYVAAAAAGVFWAEDGLRLLAARGRLMAALPEGGGMLAVRAGEEAALAAAAGCSDVAVAAENGPDETVLAGPRVQLEAVAAALASRGIAAAPLAVSHAFHSPAMAPMLGAFDAVLAQVRFSAPRLPFESALGEGADPSRPQHWRDHVLSAVRFASALRRLEARGPHWLLEAGPRPVLSALARSLGVPAARCLPTLRPGRSEPAALRQAAGDLWQAGVDVRWSHLQPAGARRRAGWGLPGYPFVRERHWIDLPAAAAPLEISRPNPTRTEWTAPASPRQMAFGIMFFNGLGGGTGADPYRFLCDAARFADARGFSSVWMPERHYTEFGGLYPNPSVIAAALARSTRSVRLMAGSLVAPLHHPLRIAEDWAAIDNLSGGRAGLSFASGWNPADFASHPEAYADRHEAVFRVIESVRRLWRGEAWESRDGTGQPVRVTVHPRPVQRELPVWVTAAGNPKTFERAGEIGANLLTHLLDQPPAQLAEKIARYRAARGRAGHDPEAGRVTVMVHTFLGEDDAAVRACIGSPFRSFLKSNLHLLQGLAQSRREGPGRAAMSESDREEFVSFLFERFYSERALFGRPEAAEALVETLGSAGVNEIACLLDFGAPMDDALAALPQLDRLRRRFSGTPAAEVTLRPARPKRAPRREAPVPSPAYRIAWRELPPETAAARPLEGTWIVLDEGAGFGERAAAVLKARGARPVRVEMGSTFARLDADRFQVNPLNPGDFHQLLTQLPGKAGGAVHLWNLDLGHAAAVTVEGVRAGLLAGVASLLHLAQAMGRAQAPGRIWLVTRGARGDAGAGGEPAAVASAPAWGLARVLALEYSDSWGGAIDLDFTPSEGEAERLADELARPDGEDQLAWRGGRRVVPRLIPDEPGDFAPIAPRAGASYLITGGLGGLGRRLARWLVERGARHLVLTGLHALPPRGDWDRLPADTDELTRSKIAAVVEMERMGAAVRAEAADVCDAPRMAALFAGIDPPLAGVFHLAGLPENRPSREIVYSEHSYVMGPKTAGAWIVHELSRGLPLDWWVAFSSISAVWGSRGQPLYAAANTFLDALGQHRRALGLPATIVNWGPWADGGMVVSIDDQAQLARLGLGTTPPAEGIAALERLLALGRPQATVATVDWKLFRELFAARGRTRLFAELGDAPAGPALETTVFFKELSALPAASRAERIARWLQEAIAQTLRWPAGKLPEPDRGFFDLGMDSLLAIEVKNRLQGELGVALRATVVFNHPNVAALTEYVAGLLPPSGAASVPEEADLAALLEREARSILEGGAS